LAPGRVNHRFIDPAPEHCEPRARPVGSIGEAVYSGCKGAIIAFSKTLARELARNKINVNVVGPGPTETALLHGVMDNQPKVLEAMKRGIPISSKARGR